MSNVLLVAGIADHGNALFVYGKKNKQYRQQCLFILDKFGCHLCELSRCGNAWLAITTGHLFP